MTNHVSIEHHVDGRTVACKRATVTGGGARIRDEASRLEGLDHPGVLTFVELRETDEGPVLVSEYVGPRTLASIGPVATERAALLVADLATTVADLHARGVVHGAVRPEHVLVAGDRTVLCGFAPTVVDHPPSDDVNGIGTTLRGLLAPDLEEEPIPDRRPWRRTPWHGYRHRALLTLADQATDDDPGRRPGARALAESVGSLSGAPTSRQGPGPVREPSGPTRTAAIADLIAVHRPRRRRTYAARPTSPGRRFPVRIALLGVIGVGLGGFGIVGLADDTAPIQPAPSGLASDAPTCANPADSASADVDGDGCPEPIRLGHGWIEVGGRRYRVGRPGNALAVGDWDGDGAATVALLQRTTGDVWRFATWDPDGAVTAEPVGRFPGAVDLDRRGAAGGDVRVVQLRSGATTEVPAE
ncbi:MAG TPA: serine/threonine-protein kinase [Acidimicrobiales bacterium]